MYIIYYTDSCLLYTILICWLLQAESSAETFATAVIHGHCSTISHSASHWSTLVSLGLLSSLSDIYSLLSSKLRQISAGIQYVYLCVDLLAVYVHYVQYT